MSHDFGMDHDQLLRGLQRAVQRRKDAAAAEDQALADALRGGVKLADIAEATGYSRETLRRFARKQDIPLRREPTVVSKRQAKPEQQ